MNRIAAEYRGLTPRSHGLQLQPSGSECSRTRDKHVVVIIEPTQAPLFLSSDLRVGLVSRNPAHSSCEVFCSLNITFPLRIAPDYTVQLLTGVDTHRTIELPGPRIQNRGQRLQEILGQ